MSSSGLDPSGPSQPPLEQSYKTPGNAATAQPAENAAKQTQREDDSKGVEQRVPREQSTDQSEAQPSSLGYGIRGAGPGEEARGGTHEGQGRNKELEGEQMRAPGEGEINSAVERKPGATGGEQGLETDLDKKKKEQAPAREAVKSERQEKVDVGGVLGQRGGPANPVDKGNYPNSGK